MGYWQVLRHGYLLSGSPHNLRLIGEQVTHLAGASTKEAVALAPRLLNVPYHKLLTINRILTNLGVEPVSLDVLGCFVLFCIF